jgi:5'-phosphate synthase pdxT subunit
VKALAEIGHDAFEARTVEDLARADGLVLPGGESTTMLRLLDRFGLEQALADFVRSRRPVLATCAGAILVAREVEGGQRSLAMLDVAVERNAWGRQIESFEAVGDRGTPMIFIRAPRITKVGARAEVLETLRGEPVLAREKNITAATFHPELTPDRRLHAAVFPPDRPPS